MKLIKIAQQRVAINYNSLERMIEQKKFGSDPIAEQETVCGVIYRGITNQNADSDSRSKLNAIWKGLTNNQEEQSPLNQLYISTVEKADVPNDSWAQWNIMERGSYDTHQNTLNFYYTIEKTLENTEKFLNSIPNLHKVLQQFANQNSSRMAFKIPATLWLFAKHNDSLKVFFNNIAIKDALNQTVTRFLSNNGISTSNRTHSFGQDTKGDSFGTRMAMRAQDWVQKAVNEGHPTKTIIEGFKRLESNFFKNIE
jgi:hypothetical protein